MHHKKRADLDIILDLLDEVLNTRPDSTFIKSLRHQYLERGSLSKKQLQGLYSKAQKISTISTSRLASLEAVILKMPNKFKSDVPQPKPLYEKDESIGEMMNAILAKYPQHKRVLYLKSKYDNNETLNATEINELKKFLKLA
ncbi:MAG: hypothetical protein ACTHJ5_03075 [Ilyomonas sp.]